MDCRVFDVLIDDLARHAPLETNIRQRGLEHLKDCLECRQRLAEARSLTTALRQLAAEDARLQAPPYLEGMLLNAFEEHLKTPSALDAVRKLFWRRRGWLAIAAAGVTAIAISVAGALHARRALRVGPGSRPSQAAASGSLQPFSQSVAPAQPVSEKKAGPEVQSGDHTRGTQLRPQRTTQRPATHSVWATDFMPLPYADDSMPLGDARIVRMRLPNSALASLGLPIAPETSTKDVTADVLVGDDGIPRAISLVEL